MTHFGKCTICNKDFHSQEEANSHNLCSNVQIESKQEKSKAAKNDKEKVDLSLIPYVSNLEHARAFMVGERKYGRYNYCLGHEASQLVAAAERHLQAWFNGEERDPIDGQHHLGSAMACCSMILRQQELGTLKDNRYKKDEK